MWKIEKIVKKGDYFYAIESLWKIIQTGFSIPMKLSIQLHGITAEVEHAISGNVVREFNSLDNREETADNGIRRGHTHAS